MSLIWWLLLSVLPLSLPLTVTSLLTLVLLLSASQANSTDAVGSAVPLHSKEKGKNRRERG